MHGAWSRVVLARVGGAIAAAALAAALVAPRPAMAVGSSCVPNHCADGGDTGAACAVVGGVPGYKCSCNAGYAFNGSTCLRVNPCVPNHCSDGGDKGSGVRCTATGTTYTCSCDPGYAFAGGTCANFNACTSTAMAACQTSQSGNSCVDEAPPSTAYHCTCGAGGYSGTNTTQCVPVNPCGRTPNPCQNGGDPGAVCHASGTTYTCSCDAGYSFMGGTCLKPR